MSGGLLETGLAGIGWGVSYWLQWTDAFLDGVGERVRDWQWPLGHENRVKGWLLE